MSYILTYIEAANVLRCETDDPLMLDLLQAIDASIKMATGRDWSGDSPIHPLAKEAARRRLIRWHEDPGGMVLNNLDSSISSIDGQLEALALMQETTGIPDDNLQIVTSNPKDGHDEMAITIIPVIIFNHEMAAAATSCVVLKTAAGATVTSTNTLDVTAKILTVTPTGSLAALTSYNLVITAAPDIYGQTITEPIGFRTA